MSLGSPEIGPWGWVVGALPPHPRNVNLKVSEMSAFGPPRGCASGSLWGNIFYTTIYRNIFVQNIFTVSDVRNLRFSDSQIVVSQKTNFKNYRYEISKNK